MMNEEMENEQVSERSERQERRAKRKKAERASRSRKWAAGVLAGVIVIGAAVGLGISMNDGFPSLKGVAAGGAEESSAVAVVQETEPTTPAEPEHEIKTLKLTAVGDCALGKERKMANKGSFDAFYKDKGADYFFENVRSIFQEDDVTIVNLEGALTTSKSFKSSKRYNIKGDPAYVDVLSGSSVEIAGLGNNHTGDYGAKGVEQTKKTLEDVGIAWALDKDVAYYTTDQGLRLALVSKDMTNATKKKKNEMATVIRTLKTAGEVDLVVAACHWGPESEHNPSKVQKTVGHMMADAGADLVIGHHPHVLQGVEIYNGTPIVYSLGNFCFGGNRKPKELESMIYQQTFTFVDGVLQPELDIQVIPIRCSTSEKKVNNYQPMLLDGKAKNQLIESINSWSKKLGETTFDYEGRLFVKGMVRDESEAEAEPAAAAEAADMKGEETEAETAEVNEQEAPGEDADDEESAA